MRKSGSKHSKFVPISTADIVQEKVLFPGRRACLCEATKHELINNCLRCGRIVCEQEGSGPCFTCSHLVCTKKQQEVIMRQSKQSYKLLDKLMSQDNSKENTVHDEKDTKLQAALEHRNQLLEYDRNVTSRTKVIDDENDYFQTDSRWLSEKEKKILKKKVDERNDLLHNRQKQLLTLDFAGRKIIEEKPQINFNPQELLLKSDTSIFECENAPSIDMPVDYQPKFLDTNEGFYHTPVNNEENKHLHIRIQDKELQTMSDEGLCLSLHQPYASLLVSGIKKHEGRVWYTSYRGLLWIHAAGKTVLKEEIIQLEHFYKSILGPCEFPKSYPTGCLLGCVDLVDCLPQEEYKTQFPEGENASPYVFICENPRQLAIKFPMKAKHKIFKLESNIHQAAKKTLIRKIH